MHATPITLTGAVAECVLDETPGSRYVVKFAQGDFIAVCFGVDARKPTAKFRHPNLAVSAECFHEFKHSGRNGKRWTAKPGVDHWFIFPKSVVSILPEKGHSFVKAMIGDVPVVFNVGGGTSANGGWSDYVGEHVHVLIDHPLRDLRRVAEFAVRGSRFEEGLLKAVQEKALSEEERRGYLQQVSAATVMAQVLARFRLNKAPVKVCLGPEHSAGGAKEGTLVDVEFCRRTVWRTPTADEKKAKPGVSKIGQAKDIRRVRFLVTQFAGDGAFRVPPHSVDWVRTAELNGLLLA